MISMVHVVRCRVLRSTCSSVIYTGSHVFTCPTAAVCSKYGVSRALSRSSPSWRSYSSGQSTPPNDNPSTWRKGIDTIKAFAQGAKLIVSDVRKLSRLMRETGGFQIRGGTPMNRPGNAVQLEHIRFIYKTSADIKKVLPTLTLFCIPLLGYIAPFLALLFPDKLLSSHFWSEQQKKELTEKLLLKRRESIHELLQQITNSDDPLSVAIKGFQNQQEFTDGGGIFKNVSSDITQLSTYQLQLLFNCWGVSRVIIPLKWFQCRKLRKHLHYIQTCDWIVQRDGLKQLDKDTKLELVRERLPLIKDTSNLDVVLKKWINTMSITTTGNETVNEVILAHKFLLILTGEESS